MICEKDKRSLQLLAHWNYFLALEQDLITLSRYIEFSEQNFEAYSLEMARILMASTQEVDVLLKEICASDKNNSSKMKIDDYRAFFANADEWDIDKKAFLRNMILIPRHNIHLSPWENWKPGKAPDWWTANNKIKHHRATEFHRANLSNVLNSVAALFATNLFLLIPFGRNLIESEIAEELKLFMSERDYVWGWGTFEGGGQINEAD